MWEGVAPPVPHAYTSRLWHPAQVREVQALRSEMKSILRKAQIARSEIEAATSAELAKRQLQLDRERKRADAALKSGEGRLQVKYVGDKEAPRPYPRCLHPDPNPIPTSIPSQSQFHPNLNPVFTPTTTPPPDRR